MRVLWITYDLFNSIDSLVIGKPTFGRPWVESLFSHIKNIPELTIAIATPVENSTNQKLTLNDSCYYIFEKKSNEKYSKISSKMRDGYMSILEDFKPDLIHIHGTEINLGLLKQYTNNNIPIVCSIQGIIPPCFDYLKLSIANVKYRRFKSLKNIIGRGGIDGALRKWKKYIPVEKEIFRSNFYFIGRTDWDKSYVSIYNPNAMYFTGEEILRKEFYNTNWNIDTCNRHSIFISSSAYALKGFHVLLKAVGILKKKYPNIKVISPLSSLRNDRSKVVDFLFSEDYNRFLKKEIDRLDLSEHIILKGHLSAEQMANEYKNAHVFALPSFLENSPNSLGEAMIIGTPSIVSLTGGVPSLINNEIDALSFPINDHIMLAYQIDRIFSNDDLALNLSNNAKVVSSKRYNVESVVKQYSNIYKAIISKHEERVNS